MALGYDRIVIIILVESLGEKIHKGVLIIYSVHFDVFAIDLVISLSGTLKYNHSREDVVFAIITPSVDL